jgi:hypothetical protein
VVIHAVDASSWSKGFVGYGICASRMRRDRCSIVHVSTWSSSSLWHSIIVSPAQVCMVEVGIGGLARVKYIYIYLYVSARR